MCFVTSRIHTLSPPVFLPSQNSKPMLTPILSHPRSDFVYMVPPFLAYYGALTANYTLINEAYVQCRLYRQYLRDDESSGLWRHIVQGSEVTDPRFWATGEFISL